VTYSTLMVRLELGQSNAGLLAIAGGLASRFRAHVIGIAACQPMQFVYGMGYVSADFFERDLADIKKDSEAAEAEFRTALMGRVETLEWRSTVVSGTLPSHFAHEARSADLIVTGPSTGDMFDASRRVDIGDLVMQVGRPVLITPTGAQTLAFNRALVAWKDTRETRRAIFNALPLLKQVAQVSVVEIAVDDRLSVARRHLEDVVGWLGRHGIKADSAAIRSTGSDLDQLCAVSKENGADFIVAGAYGHSRMREWVLGGMTRDLPLRSDLCSVVSH
jgi:nucleotide-binding universal stress UspA family protein